MPQIALSAQDLTSHVHLYVDQQVSRQIVPSAGIIMTLQGIMIAPMKNRYEYIVPGDASSLAAIRWVVTRIAAAAGWQGETLDAIELAVDEACSNVLDHAYKHCSPKPPVLIVMKSAENTFTVDVIDEGEKLDWDAYSEPKFPDHWLEGNMRGAGLYIMNRCMDEVTYETLDDERNRMRMVKRKK